MSVCAGSQLEWSFPSGGHKGKASYAWGPFGGGDPGLGPTGGP